jgi:hypothetical protein
LVLLDESGDELGDEILLAPWESDGLLEDALELSDGAWAPNFLRAIAEDGLDANAKSASELRKHVGARRRGSGFPVGDGL